MNDGFSQIVTQTWILVNGCSFVEVFVYRGHDVIDNRCLIKKMVPSSNSDSVLRTIICIRFPFNFAGCLKPTFVCFEVLSTVR
jgi:hypothetical protein